MKKQLLFVLTLLILVSSLPCVASAMTQEEYEQKIHEIYANVSDDELKFLFEAIQFELAYRGYKFDFDETHQAATAQKQEASQKEVTVPPGSYTIGSDIPAGIYTIVPTGIISMLTVKDASGGLVTMHSLSGDTQVGKLELKAGQMIDIVGESVIFKPYAGLGF